MKTRLTVRRIVRLLAVLFVLLLGTGVVADAQTFTFTKIADTNTTMPGYGIPFASLGGPVIDRGVVAFQGGGSCFCFREIGVYTSQGGALQTIADTTMSIPGVGGTFQFVGGPAVGGVAFAFRGEGASSGGVYLSTASVLTTVADTHTAIPAGSGMFQSFGIVSIDGGGVVFHGVGGSSQFGIYRASGSSMTAIADTSTAVPGGVGTFRLFSSPDANAGEVVFMGLDTSFREGLYMTAAGTLVKIVDTVTTIPGRDVPFNFFGNPSLNNGIVAFQGFDEFAVGGIYLGNGGDLTVIADQTTMMPDRPELFAYFSDPALDGDAVAFIGLDVLGVGGVYLSRGGTLTKVLVAGDTLDGKLVTGAGVGRGAMSGNDIALSVTFDDGSWGIYVATMPPAGPLAVTIDIRPRGLRNRIHLDSDGAVPAAVLSSSTFDAATVDPASVTLAGAPVKIKRDGRLAASIEDVNGDGLADLLVHVEISAMTLTLEDHEAVLEGRTFDGVAIRGVDSVRVKP